MGIVIAIIIILCVSVYFIFDLLRPIKVKDSTYMKVKEVYVARMRLANEIERSAFFKFIYLILERLK